MTKTYVITGACSGIGKALAENLSKNNIVFASYRSEGGECLLKNISSDIHPFYVDYSKPETISDAVKKIRDNCSKIDTIINIAGCVVAGPIEKIKINEIRRQFDVNVFGHLELTQGLIDLLNNGKIINISSMASYGIFPFIAPYCASKRALDILFNSLLIENKRNIKVVSVRPGVISTPLWNKSVEENTKNLSDICGYEKEMQYIMENAKKNATCGLNVNKVVEKVLKADSLNNPKPIYTVGCDALCARIISKLPQGMLNKIIKMGIHLRIK